MSNKHPKGRAAVEDQDDDEFEGTGKTEAEIRAEVIAHGKEVRALCTLAGFPDLADGFIAEDKTLSEVTAALTAKKAEGKKDDKKDDKKDGKKDGKSAETSARHVVDPDNGNARESKTLDTVDVYARWNGVGKKKG